MFNPNDKLPERRPISARPNGFALAFFIIMAVLFITYFFRGDSTPIREVPYSDFTRFAEQNQIESVTIHDNNTMDIFLKGTAGEIGRASCRERV